MDQTTMTAEAPVAAGLRYAGFWSRFAARIIDTLITGAAALILNLVFKALGFPALLTSILVALVVFGYFFYMTKRYAATVGKMAINIKVVSEHGGDLSWRTVFMREFLGKIASGMILNIGYIMVAFTQRKQGLHDKIAETVVVHNDSVRDNKSLVIVINTVALAIMSILLVIGVLGLFALVKLAECEKTKTCPQVSATTTSPIRAY